MTETVVIYLDSVIKHRNKSEYRTINRAYCTYNGQYYEEVGDGYLIRKLLSILRANKCPITAKVEVYRGDTPCFVPMALNRWLSLDLDGNKIDRRPNQFKRSKVKQYGMETY